MDLKLLHELIEPEVTSLGYDLVRVAMIGGTSDPTLQVMAERPDTRQLDLSDCEAISRRLSERLDELEAQDRDPIPGGYRLEVSSPGIDRPLTRLKGYADWAGREARFNLGGPLDGRKQFSGELAGTDGDQVRLSGKDGRDYVLPFAAIHSAKLLLTDKLIKSTAPLSALGADEILETPTEGADQIFTQDDQD